MTETSVEEPIVASREDPGLSGSSSLSSAVTLPVDPLLGRISRVDMEEIAEIMLKKMKEKGRSSGTGKGNDTIQKREREKERSIGF